MNLLRIVGYFFSEAVASLLRSWKVSLLAILTIAMSIFIGGTFLLLSGNLNQVVENWREQARIIVYFDETADADDLARLRDKAQRAPWVTQIREISGAEARERFRTTFPSVQELLESWENEPLPPSMEVGFDAERVEVAEFEDWVDDLSSESTVVMVDDDRDWLRQLDAFIAILRGLGLVVGSILLGAAVVTIASVIRLTAYLYRDEIAVMRLVGATELYIRGPFYFEGLIQGFLGGTVALVGLLGAYLALNPTSSTVLLGTVLVNRFLSWQASVALLALGTAAGLLGAILSLRRESLS